MGVFCFAVNSALRCCGKISILIISCENDYWHQKPWNWEMKSVISAFYLGFLREVREEKLGQVFLTNIYTLYNTYMYSYVCMYICRCMYIWTLSTGESPVLIILPGKSWRELRWQESGNVMFADLRQFSPTKQPSGVSFNSTKLSKHVRGEFNDAPDVSLLVVRNQMRYSWPDLWPIIDLYLII